MLDQSTRAQLKYRSELKIRFDFGGVTLDADLLDTTTAQLITTKLPFSATAHTWDGGIYFEIPLELCREPDARTGVAPGEIAYCPATHAIGISFGHAPIPSNKGPWNIWARTKGDVKKVLAQVKDGTEVKVRGWLEPPLNADRPA